MNIEFEFEKASSSMSGYCEVRMYIGNRLVIPTTKDNEKDAVNETIDYLIDELNKKRVK